MEEEVAMRLRKGAEKWKRACSSSYLTRNLLPGIMLGHDILIAPQIYLAKERGKIHSIYSYQLLVCVKTWCDAAGDFSRARIPRGT